MTTQTRNLLKLSLAVILYVIVLVMFVNIMLKRLYGETTPYFTPGDDCQSQIIEAIGKAKFSICIQAYNFTDEKIAKALIDRDRSLLGRVYILLDKTASLGNGSQASYCKEKELNVRTDSKHRISHNKIIIIDYQEDHKDDPGATVFTGSYNFSVNAQNSNAENLLVINLRDQKDKDLKTIQAYYTNWKKHWLHSDNYQPPEEIPTPKPSTKKPVRPIKPKRVNGKIVLPPGTRIGANGLPVPQDFPFPEFLPNQSKPYLTTPDFQIREKK